MNIILTAFGNGIIRYDNETVIRVLKVLKYNYPDELDYYNFFVDLWGAVVIDIKSAYFFKKNVII